MKKILTAILCAISIGGSTAYADKGVYNGDTAYTNVKVTGIAFESSGASANFAFTIDDPNAVDAKTLVFTSDEYSGDRLKELYSLVMSAYVSGKPIARITWGAYLTAGNTRYVKARRFEAGTLF